MNNKRKPPKLRKEDGLTLTIGGFLEGICEKGMRIMRRRIYCNFLLLACILVLNC